MFKLFASDDDKNNIKKLREAFNTAKDPKKLLKSCLNLGSVNPHHEDEFIKAKHCDSITYYRESTIKKLKVVLDKGVEQERDLTKILEEYNIGESDIAAILCDEILGIAEISGACVLIRKILNNENKVPVPLGAKQFDSHEIPQDFRDEVKNHVNKILKGDNSKHHKDELKKILEGYNSQHQQLTDTMNKKVHKLIPETQSPPPQRKKEEAPSSLTSELTKNN